MPMGEWRYSPMHQVKVNDQLQAPAALPPGKYLSVSTGRRLGSARTSLLIMW